MRRRNLLILFALCLALFAATAAVQAGEDEGIEWKYPDSPTEVSTYAALRAALPGGEGTPDENNIVWIPYARLSESLELSEDQSIATLGKLLIPNGVTLSINGSFEAEVEIESGGAVEVKCGGILSTTMGGNIENSGLITVEPSAALESKMGGSIVNKSGGSIALNGLLYAGGHIAYPEANDGGEASNANPEVHVWLENSGSISGRGHIVLKRLHNTTTESEEDNAELRIRGSETAKTRLGSGCEVPLYTEAVSFDELKTLNSSGSIDGIYLNGTSNGSYGIYLMGIDDESLKAVSEMHVTEDFALSKRLCLDWVDLIVDKGCTLTIPRLEDLSFAGRRTRIVVEAEGLSAKAGGTIAVGSGSAKNIISGASSENALFTVTNNIMSLSPGEYAVFDYPVRAKGNLDGDQSWDGAWYYLHNGGEKGRAEVSGVMPASASLQLVSDGALEFTGNTSGIGVLDARDSVSVSEGAEVGIGHVLYRYSSSASTLKGQTTEYETAVDLNSGRAYDDIFDNQLPVEDGKTYLDYIEDGEIVEIVPLSPSRSGYSFRGWSFSSNWASDEDLWTEENAAALSGLEIKEESVHNADTRHYIEMQDFPVLMTADWRKNSSSGGSSGGSGSAGNQTIVEIPTGADENGETAAAETTEVITEAVIASALETGEAVKLDTEALAGSTSEEAALIRISVGGARDAAVKIEIPVAAVTASDVVVLVNADGSEEIISKTELTEEGLVIEVRSDVSVKIVSNSKEFGDIEEGYWGSEAISFVSSRELFNGTGGGNFSPNEGMTRAMLATVLFRMEKGEAKGEAEFTDVAGDAWYSEAVSWAAEQGIIQGYGNTFGTADLISREQLITMLWRLDGRPEAEAVDSGASPWAEEAMSWAVGIGLIEGDGSGYNAAGSATRAETATLLMRYINL